MGSKSSELGRPASVMGCSKKKADSMQSGIEKEQHGELRQVCPQQWRQKGAMSWATAGTRYAP